jgi:uracil-DNA glycosylase
MPRENGLSNVFLDSLRSHLNPKTQTDSIEFLYAYTAEGNRRWSNLTSYLRYMQTVQPDILMIGEAPGYRGTSVSGVPFLSEGMIKQRTASESVIPVHEYVPSIQYSNESGYEATSKIMWDVLDEAQTSRLPLLWAVFPNHPHIVDNIMTNRKPTKSEIADYSRVLSLLLKVYPIQYIAAIGNVAYDTLSSNTDCPVIKLRHPARGGAKKFKDGLHSLLKDVYGR